MSHNAYTDGWWCTHCGSFQYKCIYAWAVNNGIWHCGRKYLNWCTPFWPYSQWYVSLTDIVKNTKWICLSTIDKSWGAWQVIWEFMKPFPIICLFLNGFQKTYCPKNINKIWYCFDWNDHFWKLLLKQGLWGEWDTYCGGNFHLSNCEQFTRKNSIFSIICCLVWTLGKDRPLPFWKYLERQHSLKVFRQSQAYRCGVL